MPDTEPQPVPAEEITSPAGEPQTATPAPEPAPAINNQQPDTDNQQPAIDTLQPTPDDQQPATENLQPATDNPQPSESTQTPQPIQTPAPQQPSEPARPHPRSLLQRAREKIQFRKKAKLEKIMAYASKKRSITNDDIEKLLRVSDATATRYCAELVRQGRLKPSGVRGSAKYEPL